MLERLASVAAALTSEGLQQLQSKTTKPTESSASARLFSQHMLCSRLFIQPPASPASHRSDDLPSPGSPGSTSSQTTRLRRRRKSEHTIINNVNNIEPPQAVKNYLLMPDSCKPDSVACCAVAENSSIFPETCKDKYSKCKDTKVCQSIFGNPVDGALRKQAQSKGLMEGSTVSVGFPRLQDAGWQVVDDPEVLKGLQQDVEKEYFQTALDVHGISIVQKAMQPKQQMMISFRKLEIPGTAAEVRGVSETLRKINHQHVVKLLEACEDDECVHFIYESADGAGFLPMLYMQGKVQPPDAARILQQISAALTIGKKSNSQQLDWSLWHIMSSGFKSLSPFKLFGIGLAGVLHNGRRSPVQESNYLLRESATFMSPEISFWMIKTKGMSPYKGLTQKQRDSTDVFSLGAIAYTIITGHTLYGGPNEDAILQKAHAGKASFGVELANIEENGQELIQTMLEKRSEVRPPIESLITSSWVLYTARIGETEQDVQRIVKRLFKFAQMDPVLRAISQLVAHSLRSEKKAEIEEAFRMLDLNGDGEVDIKEMSTVAAEKDKVRQIFKAIDKDGTNSLDLDEFIQGNVYAEEILTERTLRAAFAYMDQDGSGCITPGELLQTLRRFESGVEPREVIHFIASAGNLGSPTGSPRGSPRGSSPRSVESSPRSIAANGNDDDDDDMDKELDFEEFRLNFPWIKSVKSMIDKRIRRSSVRQKACQETYDILEEQIVAWLKKFKVATQSIIQIHEENGIDGGGGDRQTCGRLTKAISSIVKLIKKQPKLELAPGADLALAEVSAEQNRRKSVNSSEPLSLATMKKQRRRLSSELEETGCMSLCHPLFSKIASCLDEMMVLQDRAERNQLQENKSRRKHAMINITTDSLGLCETIIEWGDQYIAEQGALLEACGKDEARMRVFPSTLRGMKICDDEETLKLIEKYRQERKEEHIAQEKKMKAIVAARRTRRDSDASVSPPGSIASSDVGSILSLFSPSQSPASSPRSPDSSSGYLKAGRRRNSEAELVGTNGARRGSWAGVTQTGILTSFLTGTGKEASKQTGSTQRRSSAPAIFDTV
eukprot:gnl/MRDRNA2_/MRDRNA2_108747_c0_seq1.p1 gnl/MRDRNA2_/MRDRNA2_108747_c0~~gnl/MRDRNA2_/MRDRNA2_108747_c0_seq1.p1  ORF type:complete len:1064 (+),score=204.04 gnl/MRDRNA2_/MRDRNA2_108747_c0_seq1:176-3367(+)